MRAAIREEVFWWLVERLARVPVPIPGRSRRYAAAHRQLYTEAGWRAPDA